MAVVAPMDRKSPTNFKSSRLLLRAGLLTWRRAAMLAAGGVYGPHLLMCLYTQFWISCSHCKHAVWAITPLCPGLLVLELGRALLGFPRPDESVGTLAAVAVSTLLLVGVAVGLRQAGRWWPVVAILVFLAASAAAVMILGAIRA